MPRTHRPRRGSMQFWHRVRAARIYPRVRSWPKSDAPELLGFAGYKAGMTHICFVDESPTSLMKGETITQPITVLECPPLRVAGLIFYSIDFYGLKPITQIFSAQLDRELAKKLALPKKYDTEAKLKEIEAKLNNISEIRVLVYTNPKATCIGKKKPEIFELGIGGASIQDKFNFAKGLLGKEVKEVRIGDMLKAGAFVDLHAVTKGKGFQGSVQRFGIGLKRHKSEKGRRRPGNLGPWHPSKVNWRVAQAGQMGFHNRVEYNKEILFVGDKPEDVNPKGGFVRYGRIKNDYILVKGSVPGPAKRLIKIVQSIRAKPARTPPEIKYIGKESKQ